jgi:3'-phosphoadenosine 5'-phosphosulfate sulfotransferase (PAPS reductase)/FAD synthetase
MDKKIKHIVNFSGGKDSTAMLLRMKELNMKIDKLMFCDNGLEYPEVYEYMKKIEKLVGMKITFVRPKKSFEELFYTVIKKGKRKGQIRGFPFVITQCWMQRDLKVRPMEKMQSKEDFVYLGINYDEKDRVQKDETRKIKNLKYPLIEWKWTSQDCLNYLRKKNLLPPLYKLFKRTGCWLCPKQSLLSLKILYLYYPELWEKLKKLEKDSPHGFKPNFSLERFEKRLHNTIIKDFAKGS